LAAKLGPETASNNPAAIATTRNLAAGIFIAADISANILSPFRARSLAPFPVTVVGCDSSLAK
jgi:hypothetical protein